jgi:hypothetical protein
MIKLYKTNKLLDVFLFLRARPFTDSMDEASICMNAILGNDMTEELGLFLHERAFAQFRIETVLAEECKDRADVFHVFSLGTRINKDVIKVYDNPLVEDRVKHP